MAYAAEGRALHFELAFGCLGPSSGGWVAWVSFGVLFVSVEAAFVVSSVGVEIQKSEALAFVEQAFAVSHIEDEV